MHGPPASRSRALHPSAGSQYDTAKEAFAKTGLSGLGLHVASALATGLAATVFGSPIDVLKSRWMASRGDAGARLVGLVKNPVAKEGLGGFYKGFGANFARMAGWNIVFFVTFEQIKAAMGDSKER